MPLQKFTADPASMQAINKDQRKERESSLLRHSGTRDHAPTRQLGDRVKVTTNATLHELSNSTIYVSPESVTAGLGPYHFVGITERFDESMVRCELCKLVEPLILMALLAPSTRWY